MIRINIAFSLMVLAIVCVMVAVGSTRKFCTGYWYPESQQCVPFGRS